MVPSFRRNIKPGENSKSFADILGPTATAIEFVSIKQLTTGRHNTELIVIVEEHGVREHRTLYYNRLNLEHVLFGVTGIPNDLTEAVKFLNEQGFDFTVDDLMIKGGVITTRPTSLGYYIKGQTDNGSNDVGEYARIIKELDLSDPDKFDIVPGRLTLYNQHIQRISGDAIKGVLKKDTLTQGDVSITSFTALSGLWETQDSGHDGVPNGRLVVTNDLDPLLASAEFILEPEKIYYIGNIANNSGHGETDVNIYPTADRDKNFFNIKLTYPNPADWNGTWRLYWINQNGTSVEQSLPVSVNGSDISNLLFSTIDGFGYYYNVLGGELTDLGASLFTKHISSPIDEIVVGVSFQPKTGYNTDGSYIAMKYISNYFSYSPCSVKINHGKFTLKPEFGKSFAWMVFVSDERPIDFCESIKLNQTQPPEGSYMLQFIYQNDKLNVALVDVKMSPIGQLQNLTVTEEDGAELEVDLVNNKTELRINGNLLATLPNIKKWFSFSDFTSAIMSSSIDYETQEIEYDCSELIAGYELKLEGFEDGERFKVNADFELLGKQVKAGDIIEFYNDTNDILVSRPALQPSGPPSDTSIVPLEVDFGQYQDPSGFDFSVWYDPALKSVFCCGSFQYNPNFGGYPFRVNCNPIKEYFTGTLNRLNGIIQAQDWATNSWMWLNLNPNLVYLATESHANVSIVFNSASGYDHWIYTPTLKLYHHN